MNSLTITLLILFAAFVLVPITMAYHEKKLINALAVGKRYVYRVDSNNPWLDADKYMIITELKAGWVRCTHGGYKSIDRSASDFVTLFKEVK